MKRIAWAWCAWALCAAAAGWARPDDGLPDAVALVIGDGVSVELLTAARAYAHGAQGRLEVEKFPRVALVRTWSATDAVTDSAAAATAMARGVKGDNRSVGMGAPGQPAGPSLLDLARQRGWSTGVVTDDSVTGGTPAPFYLEHGNRDQHAEIAVKVVEALGSRVDLVLGGGGDWFPPELRERARSAGAEVAGEWPVTREGRPAEAKPLLGLFHPDTFPYMADGPRSPRLDEMARFAAAELKARGKPYLLVVEASLPDKASHLNNAKRAILEVIEMDRAVAALREALGPRGLVVATADHGTGGLAFNGYLPLRVRGDSLLQRNPVTGVPVLSWATGPGGPQPGAAAPGPDSEGDALAPTTAQPAAHHAKSAAHTGGDVWLAAAGPGSERFEGFMENTGIFEVLRGLIEGR